MTASRGALVALLLAALAGCDARKNAEKVYYASAQRMFRVPSANMMPTVKPGWNAAVVEGYYRDHPVERFDLVVVRVAGEPQLPPEEQDIFVLTRVVALGGETVSVEGGKVYVNGVEERRTFDIVPHDPQEKFGPSKVPPGEYFLMGDNRPDSLDSRYWVKRTKSLDEFYGKVVKIFPE